MLLLVICVVVDPNAATLAPSTTTSATKTPPVTREMSFRMAIPS